MKAIMKKILAAILSLALCVSAFAGYSAPSFRPSAPSFSYRPSTPSYSYRPSVPSVVPTYKSAPAPTYKAPPAPAMSKQASAWNMSGSKPKQPVPIAPAPGSTHTTIIQQAPQSSWMRWLPLGMLLWFGYSQSHASMPAPAVPASAASGAW